MESYEKSARSYPGINMYVVKCDFLQALGEISEELGDERFAGRVLDAAESESNVPAAEGFRMLRERFPESLELLHARIRLIGEERRMAEMQELRHRLGLDSLRGYGRLILNGFKTFRLG